MSLTGVTVSDFNPENFNALLANSAEEPMVRPVSAPFGQVHQVLMDPSAACWAKPVDFAVVWTQPQAVLPSFRRALSFEEASVEEILEDVDQFATLLVGLKDRAETIFVPSWTLNPRERCRGLFDLADPRGSANLLMQINHRLCELLAEESGIYVLNASRWVQAAGSQAFSSKLWYMAKVAFGSAVFKQAASEIKGALRAVEGGARKLIVLDLDNTLWGGIVGEVGWQQLALGGHDPVGEAFVDFQRAVKVLQRQGVVLAIVSKNEEKVALTAIDEHPEMVLRRGDFAAWRINWQDKARNVTEVVAELNLGLQSTVFIDDNPVERARVGEALSEVLVPEWPEDPLQYGAALEALACFATPTLTEEDLQRAEMYQSERQRGLAKAEVGSLDDWLETLGTTILVAALSPADLPRAAQLLNKTNQMNLATRRLPEAALEEWSRAPGHRVWTFKVSDRFGSQGLTGLLGVAQEGSRLQVLDFLLSCRVMGRKVEDVMLAVAVEYAQKNGLAGGDIQYLPTEKNVPCLAFFKGTALRFDPDEQSFHWERTDAFEMPQQVRVELTEP